MLATFVIGLREGLEAALIVSIVAAFLRKQGRLDLLRWVYVGIAAAVLLCTGVGVALRVLSHELPQRQQEGLETVIGVVAVGMVTYMVVWMRRNARGLKGHLESAAGTALAEGSGWALVAMAFLAVLREGFETSVFLLAALNESRNGSLALVGALLGIAVAVGIGYALYRGGLRINLQKFFRATGVVLVLVAAGLVSSALHTAHEAGWLNAGQQSTFDLSGVVGPGTVQGALLTGVLGVQPRPVLVEVIGWTIYVLLVLPYVVWPPGRTVERRRVARVSSGAAVVAAVAAVGLFAAAPAQASAASTSRLDGVVVAAGTPSAEPGQVKVTLPAGWTSGSAPRDLVLARTGQEDYRGVASTVYALTDDGTDDGTDGGTAGDAGPQRLSIAQVADLNGGRLPLGIAVGTTTVPVGYVTKETTTAWLDALTGRVLDVATRTAVTTSAEIGGATVQLSKVREQTARVPAATVSREVASAKQVAGDDARRALMRNLALLGAVLAGLLLLVALAVAIRPNPVDPGKTGSGQVGPGRTPATTSA